MCRLGFSSLKVETLRDDSNILLAPCRRESYLESLGLRTPSSAEKPELDDCCSTPSMGSLSTASLESLPSSPSSASLESLPDSLSMESLESLSAESTEGDLVSRSVSATSAECEVLAQMSSQTNFRQKLFRKLASSKVWAQEAQSSPKYQTVVIYDWDDTLMPTTWLRRSDFQPGDDDEDEECLQTIVQHAKKLLEIAIRAGHTYIITNAQSGWVEYSAARWGPELLPLLRKVTIISARDKFETAFPHDIWQWKIHAFLEVQKLYVAMPFTNLVALGDADYEMEAARIMGNEFEQGLVKTVKFRPNPDPEEHRMQLELVENNLERVIASVDAMKICMEKKM